MGHNSQIYSTINLQFVWCYRNRLQLRLQTFFPQITTTNFNHLIIIILLTELLGLSSLGSKHKARYEFYVSKIDLRSVYLGEGESQLELTLTLFSRADNPVKSLCSVLLWGMLGPGNIRTYNSSLLPPSFTQDNGQHHRVRVSSQTSLSHNFLTLIFSLGVVYSTALCSVVWCGVVRCSV